MSLFLVSEKRRIYWKNPKSGFWYQSSCCSPYSGGILRGELLLILWIFWGGVLYCRKGNCTCSMASKSDMWFAYWVVVVSKESFLFFTRVTKRFHDWAFWVIFLEQYQKASLLLQGFLSYVANLVDWNLDMQISL